MRSMCVGVAETGGWGKYLLFWLLTGLLIRMVGELTHMRSMCVGVAETGVGALDDPQES